MKATVRTLVCAAALCLPSIATAADGVLIAMKMTNGSNPPQTNQIQIDQRRMRMAITDTNGNQAGIMFDGTKQVMTIIDDTHKTYSELTKADLDAISAQLSGAMAQMDSMMKNMPPEQRAQMEAMMKKAGRSTGPAPTSPKVDYKKVGTGTVGKWTCDKYEGFVNGQKTNEVCTVDPKALGFTEADFAVTREMADFFKQFQQFSPAGAGQGQVFVMGKPETQGFSGIPVRSVSTSATGNQVVNELTDVHRQAFTDATFTVPSDYKKNDLLGGARGRRGR
jgi:hypothetical protein